METNYDEALTDSGLRPIQSHSSGRKYFHVWLHKLLEKLNNGFAPIIANVGETGSGKSMAGVKTLEWLINCDALNDFTSDKNLVYDVLPFLKKIHDMPIEGSNDINIHREGFIFDEGGVNFNSKDYQSQENRSIDEVIQTMRMKNCVYIFCTPDIKNLDKQIRKEIDFIISMQDPGNAQITGIKKVRNRLDGSWEYWYIPYSKWFGNWRFDMPSDEIVNEYKSKEREAKESFIQDRIDQIEEDRSDSDGLDLSDI